MYLILQILCAIGYIIAGCIVVLTLVIWHAQTVVNGLGKRKLKIKR